MDVCCMNSTEFSLPSKTMMSWCQCDVIRSRPVRLLQFVVCFCNHVLDTKTGGFTKREAARWRTDFIPDILAPRPVKRAEVAAMLKAGFHLVFLLIHPVTTAAIFVSRQSQAYAETQRKLTAQPVLSLFCSVRFSFQLWQPALTLQSHRLNKYTTQCVWGRIWPCQVFQSCHPWLFCVCWPLASWLKNGSVRCAAELGVELKGLLKLFRWEEKLQVKLDGSIPTNKSCRCSETDVVGVSAIFLHPEFHWFFITGLSVSAEVTADFTASCQQVVNKRREVKYEGAELRC